MSVATIERITCTPYNLIVDTKVHYNASSRPSIAGLPQIFWRDATPWREANLWAMERATDRVTRLRTVKSNLTNLLNYANFLEEHSLLWFAFPRRKADRCLVQYRGWLVSERDAGRISPGTASEYMRNAVSFYRWLLSRGLLSSEFPLWRDKAAYIRYFDSVGFERTMLRLTTDLAIPNRRRAGDSLEDGLFPVSNADRDSILGFCKENGTPELYRMLALGFFTGMRIGSICDLKIQTLRNAVPDPAAPGLYKIAIGPGAKPSVQTKFDVTGQVWIPESLLEDLLSYATSLHRSKRQLKANEKHRDHLFLTVQGNKFCQDGSEHATAVNTEMVRLRRGGAAAGIRALKGFHFHQSRCTFATDVATIALASGDPINAIALVRDALLHRDEATSFKYIKFVSAAPSKKAVADDFMKTFSGVAIVK